MPIDQESRRTSVMQSDGMTQGPHRDARRMSRLDPRASVQYGTGGRRMSTMSRTSFSGASIGLKPHYPEKIANTYRMIPEEKFNAGQAKKLIKGVLCNYLDGEKYDAKLCCKLAETISEVIKGRMKDLGDGRYKFVCLVSIAEKKNHGILHASRCLWSTETDNSATATHEEKELFATATVYACYFE